VIGVRKTTEQEENEKRRIDHSSSAAIVRLIVLTVGESFKSQSTTGQPKLFQHLHWAKDVNGIQSVDRDNYVLTTSNKRSKQTNRLMEYHDDHDIYDPARVWSLRIWQFLAHAESDHWVNLL
jgi:hypothetical protein